jgi:hypothetical protein
MDDRSCQTLVDQAANSQLAPKFNIFDGPGPQPTSLGGASLTTAENGHSVLEAPSDEDFWLKFNQQN